ncbi:hypothetical protein NX81_000520 [Xanthomonas vasicola]|uniref:hypothetical protein n=1 Tax=Xanthomonas vasicola TaxID=56459 RepID=UPI000F8591DF|nr:hypothetical protein [Xanthomonas vasicola]AZR21111.1 hypothetical protein NX81_000520 [Xanthomonas vasicola]
MKSRLDSISPELVKKVYLAGEAQKRHAVVAACNHALNAVAPLDPNYDFLINDITLGVLFSDEKLSQINEVVSSLDERYFAAQDEGGENIGRGEDYLSFFSQARAIAALMYAGKGESSFYACEAIYEASMALDDSQQLISHLLLDLTEGDTSDTQAK